MKSLKQILDERKKGKSRRAVREFQDYGYRMAVRLGDLKHKSLYIKLAKTERRELLEAAKRYAIDSNSDKKGAVFMWKLKELKGTGKK